MHVKKEDEKCLSQSPPPMAFYFLSSIPEFLIMTTTRLQVSAINSEGCWKDYFQGSGHFPDSMEWTNYYVKSHKGKIKAELDDKIHEFLKNLKSKKPKILVRICKHKRVRPAERLKALQQRYDKAKELLEQLKNRQKQLKQCPTLDPSPRISIKQEKPNTTTLTIEPTRTTPPEENENPPPIPQNGVNNSADEGLTLDIVAKDTRKRVKQMASGSASPASTVDARLVLKKPKLDSHPCKPNDKKEKVNGDVNPSNSNVTPAPNETHDEDDDLGLNGVSEVGSQDSLDIEEEDETLEMIKAQIVRKLHGQISNSDMHQIRQELSRLKEEKLWMRNFRKMPFTFTMLQILFLDK